MVDPRTLRPIEQEATCHLIPECIGLNKVIVERGGTPTVRLDRAYDNRIGAKCDGQLRNYLAAVFGHFGGMIQGKVAIEGGSQNLTALFAPKNGVLLILGPEESEQVKQFQRRALAVQDGSIKLKWFRSDAGDEIGAFVSVIHSAMLVLHQRREPRLLGPQFDQSRALLSGMMADALVTSDFQIIRRMVCWQLQCDQRKVAGNKAISVDHIRDFHDPEFEAADEILTRFPSNCVAEEGGCLTVTLPYSRSLRAKVRFSLDGSQES
jgi:hypothetical protein